MANKNIFSGNGAEADLCSRIYHKLMQRKLVSYKDIVIAYTGKTEDDLKRKAFSSLGIYKPLKKAFPAVCKAIEAKVPGSIKSEKTGNTTAYIYTGDDDDPLKEELQALELRSMKDYVEFCKASVGLFPTGWFASYFERTQLLLDARREKEKGGIHLSSSLEQILNNLELLPLLNEYILKKKVVKFVYHPFEEESRELTFHPQFLKEYNGRWFLLGKAESESYYPFTAALDRIVGEVTVEDSLDYEAAAPGFYRDYFKDIVGVSHMVGMKKEKVVIHTLTKYFHGLLMTKPLHHSQCETQPYDEKKQYGEVTIDVEPNRELIGKIVMYGQNMVVKSPETLRRQIHDVLAAQLQLYAEK